MCHTIVGNLLHLSAGLYQLSQRSAQTALYNCNLKQLEDLREKSQFEFLDHYHLIVHVSVWRMSCPAHLPDQMPQIPHHMRYGTYSYLPALICVED